MKDVNGKEIVEGDTVAFGLTTKYGGLGRLGTGTVLAVGATAVVVKSAGHYHPITTQKNQRVVVLGR